jgi:hypothetical protein
MLRTYFNLGPHTIKGVMCIIDDMAIADKGKAEHLPDGEFHKNKIDECLLYYPFRYIESLWFIKGIPIKKSCHCVPLNKTNNRKMQLDPT